MLKTKTIAILLVLACRPQLAVTRLPPTISTPMNWTTSALKPTPWHRDPSCPAW